MVWTANPLNLLVVDDTHRQPDFVGWYSYNSDLLNATPSLRPGKGLKLGHSQIVPLVRNGNGNDTITLSAGQAITSHPQSGSTFPTSIPATPGTNYTLGVTSVGISGSRLVSRTKFSIFWINAANQIISETAQGIISDFNLGVRNWVIGQAPDDTVGMVVLFSADYAITLSYPTLAEGNIDIRKGNPVFIGDHIGSLGNLFYDDPESSGIPWMDGWSNEFGVRLAPTATTLNVPANSEARLYFREDPDAPTTMGIQIQPDQEYFFGLTESPTRTSATVTLRVYDLSGTRLLATYNPIISGNRFQFSFLAPAYSAWLSVKIVADNNNTSFINPVLSNGLDDPGDLPPVIYGNFQMYFEFKSDTRNIVSKQYQFITENLDLVPNRIVFLSESLIKATGSTWQFRTDSLKTVGITKQFNSDIADVMHKNFVFLTDNQAKISITNVFLTDNLHKLGSKSWVFTTDSRNKISKTGTFVSDTLQIVGQRSYQGGLQTSLDLLTDEQLMTQYATRHPTRDWTFDSENLIRVGANSFVLLSDNLQRVGPKNYVFNTDVTNHVVRGIIFNSDTLDTNQSRFVLKSDVIGGVATQFVLISDNTQDVLKNIALVSDTRKTVSPRTQLRSDNTKTVSVRFRFQSSTNGTRNRRVISSRPLNNIGA